MRMSVRVAICCAAFLLAFVAPSPGQVVSDGQLGNLPPLASGTTPNMAQNAAAGSVPLVSPLPANPASAASGQEGTNGQAKQEAGAQDKLAALDKTVTELSKKLTVVTADENFKLVLGGAIIGDFLFNERRPVAP